MFYFNDIFTVPVATSTPKTLTEKQTTTTTSTYLTTESTYNEGLHRKDRECLNGKKQDMN